MSDQDAAQAIADREQRKRHVRAGARRGIQRERQVRHHFEDQGWVAFRAPASLGAADVVALRDGDRPLLIEVKSTSGGPYERFGPADRFELSEVARRAGADALLAYWPSRGDLEFVPESEWPS